ncbi:hypothetical protein KCU88_g179, partial [Aureobasidium melanogenum]
LPQSRMTPEASRYWSVPYQVLAMRIAWPLNYSKIDRRRLCRLRARENFDVEAGSQVTIDPGKERRPVRRLDKYLGLHEKGRACVLSRSRASRKHGGRHGGKSTSHMNPAMDIWFILG